MLLFISKSDNHCLGYIGIGNWGQKLEGYELCVELAQALLYDLRPLRPVEKEILLLQCSEGFPLTAMFPEK